MQTEYHSLVDINVFERKVLYVLGNEPVHIDSIADLSGKMFLNH